MASRLDAVLRAGQVRSTATEADGESLTRALKRTTLVPTGACVPRNFDPDYCAYDRYYSIGVGLVSVTLTALLESEIPQRVVIGLSKGIRDMLGNYCHTPNVGWGNDWDVWDDKSDEVGFFTESSKTNARKEF